MDFLNSLFKRKLSHNLIEGDAQLRAIFYTLMCISIVVIFSASTTLAWQKQDGNLSYYPLHHVIYLFVSWVATYLVSKIDPKVFNRFAVFLCLIGIVLTMMTPFIGVSINGSTRWLRFSGIQFQPSEIAKITLIFFVAKVLSIHKKNPAKALWPIIIATLLVIGPILKDNLSTVLLIVATVGSMMIIGSVPIGRLMSLLIGLVTLATAYMYIVPEEYQMERIKTWKARFERFWSDDDDADDNGKNYQARQAELAVAHSGLLGTGPGKSYVKNFLPMASSDFVYSTILEEFGVIGGLGIIGLFIWLLYRVIRIAMRCDSAFEIYLILGLAIILCLQAIINMAVGVGLMPVTGQTLPLISMGGTSNVTVGIVMGVIFSVSSHNMPASSKQEAAPVQKDDNEFSNDDVEDIEDNE